MYGRNARIATNKPTRQRDVLRDARDAQRGLRARLAAVRGFNGAEWMQHRAGPPRRSCRETRPRRQPLLTRLQRPRVSRWAHERARVWTWRARMGQAGVGQAHHITERYQIVCRELEEEKR